MFKLMRMLPILAFALIVLFASIVKSAEVKYEFAPSPKPLLSEHSESLGVLPKVDLLIPGNPFWFLKAAKDKLVMISTLDKYSKTYYSIHLANHRLAVAHRLFVNGEAELAVATVTKAEKYLEEAALSEKQLRLSGINTSDLLLELTNSAHTHQYYLESCIKMAPEEAKPILIKAANYPRRIFIESTSELAALGSLMQESPF